MKTFRPDSRGEWPRADLRKVHEWIDASFERHGQKAPHVVAIAAGEFAYDDHLYETFLELAPGVIASATWDLSEEEKQELHLARWDTIGRDTASVGAAAADVARHYLALGSDHLADRLHGLRVRVRKQLAALATPGGGPRLISLWLTGGDWLHSDEFKVILRLECLDSFLLPDVEGLLFEDPNALEEDLEHWGRTAARNYDIRHALMAEGATGTIDLLTLNAIRMFSDVSSTLRALGRGPMLWPLNGMELVCEAGNLRSHGSDRASGLSWRANSIGHPTVLPASILMAYAHRPVTELITHPMLTADMRIMDASPDPKSGMLKVELQQPRWLFCHQSGRAWEQGASSVSTGTEAVDDPATGEEK